MRITYDPQTASAEVEAHPGLRVLRCVSEDSTQRFQHPRFRTNGQRKAHAAHGHRGKVESGVFGPRFFASQVPHDGP